MNEEQALNQAMAILKEAECAIRSLNKEKSTLRQENSQLLLKVAESSKFVKFAEIVDDMIEEGILDSASRKEKIIELVSSDTSPEVFKEAMNLAPTMHSLGHLDTAQEDNNSEVNPLDRAIMTYVHNKH